MLLIGWNMKSDAGGFGNIQPIGAEIRLGGNWPLSQGLVQHAIKEASLIFTHSDLSSDIFLFRLGSF